MATHMLLYPYDQNTRESLPPMLVLQHDIQVIQPDYSDSCQLNVFVLSHTPTNAEDHMVVHVIELFASEKDRDIRFEHLIRLLTDAQDQRLYLYRSYNNLPEYREAGEV